jgi:hypothetical protein
MSGKPKSNSLEGRLLAGLTFDPACTRGARSPGGVLGVVYTSCLERGRPLYTIYRDGRRHSEVFVQKSKTRLNFTTSPRKPPKGSPKLRGNAVKWPGGGTRVEAHNLDACRLLLRHELGIRSPARTADRPHRTERTSLERQQLLTEIARCPLLELNLTAERPTHPCHDVVASQWPDSSLSDRRARWKREHHLPEPWVGHLERAPLLFVSSNPSLSSPRPALKPTTFAQPRTHIGKHLRADHPAFRHGLAAPKSNWNDDELVDRAENAFDVWMSEGTAEIDDTGQAAKAARFWVATRALAAAFYNDDVQPGHDYALTEVVHCKSKSEVGVASAVNVCAPLYLRRVIAQSPAVVVVALGDKARNALRGVFTYPDAGVVSRPLAIEGVRRRFVFLAHPNARRSRYPKHLLADEHAADLVAVQKWLAKTARPG